MSKLAIPLALAFLAGCAAIPPERAERDRLILAAIEPCKQRYQQFFFNVNMVSVMPDGRIRYWYRDFAVAESYEVDRCMAEARRDLRLGPWVPGRLVNSGPASVPFGKSGPEVVVPVRVNGVVGRMAVRRNTNLTSVTPAYAKRAGLQIVTESPMTHVVEGGRTAVVPYARARALEVGDASVEALDIAVYERLPEHAAVDGVLGSSFLGHFKMTIDPGRNLVTLEALRPRSPASPAPEWRAPVWAAGDEWRVRWESPTGRGTYVQRVEGEETLDGMVHYVTRVGSRLIYYAKATIGWHFEKRDDNVTLRRTPPLAFEWPLNVGKSWQRQYERRDGNGVTQIFRACIALEETSLKVQAGVFRTVHIRCHDRAGRTTEEWWYADEVKYWVRRRTVLSQGERVDELVSYLPTSAPTKP